MRVVLGIVLILLIAALAVWVVPGVRNSGPTGTAAVETPRQAEPPTGAEQATEPPVKAEIGANKEMAEAIAGTSANFEQEVIKSDVPVVVDFWATWCGPCRMVGPILDDLAGEYAGKVKVVKVNVDEQRELANRYQIQAIPTLMVFKGGEQVDRSVGAESKAELSKRFASLAQ